PAALADAVNGDGQALGRFEDRFQSLRALHGRDLDPVLPAVREALARGGQVVGVPRGEVQGGEDGRRRARHGGRMVQRRRTGACPIVASYDRTISTTSLDLGGWTCLERGGHSWREGRSFHSSSWRPSPAPRGRRCRRAASWEPSGTRSTPGSP